MSGRIVVLSYDKKTNSPARGRHAELLTEISQEAEALIRFVALEQSGLYDGLGQSAWVSSDPLENTVQRLRHLIEERIDAVRNAAAARP
jgi:hypothetical protein